MLSQGEIIDILREALYVALKLGGPLLLASILIGLVVAIFQAATQIHEQTLTFVPKVLILAVMLILMGSWYITTISDYIKGLFTIIAGL
ncbi:MAG: flagellar biosynthesis protein FliQ [Oscillospiraceae bacterium]